MSKAKHIPALDGLRGVAVLFVFLFHYGGGSHSSSAIVRAFALVVRAGWSGVTIFFVLSGFLITGILWDARGTPRSWGRFYMRRTLRIFPLYYATVLAVLIAAAAVHRGTYCLERIWILALYLQNVPHFAAPSMNTGSPLWTSHLWSLAVEEQFYLVWPFLIARLRTLGQARVLCLLVLLASTLVRFYVYTHHDPTTVLRVFERSGDLAVGAFIAFSYRSAAFKKLQKYALPLTVASLAAFIVTSVVSGDTAPTSLQLFAGVLFMSLAAAGVLILALSGRKVSRFFEISWLRWFGGISYGFYIVHVLLEPFFFRAPIHLFPHASRNLQIGLTFFIALAGSTLLAWLSFRFYESPWLRLKDRITARNHTSSISEAPPLGLREEVLRR